MIKLNDRQNKILGLIRKNESSGNKEILDFISKKEEKVTRLTIVRDLNKLIGYKLITRIGSGRNATYRTVEENSLLSYFDVEKYFQLPPDEREIKLKTFNFEVFDSFSKNIFVPTELKKLEELNKDYQKRIKRLSPTILKKEFERLTIELSWKSSRIEGNTYSLIDTEILIKEKKEAEGHSKEEAIMILNHKRALDYILDKKSDFQKISLAKIENIHKLIVVGMGVKENLRRRAVGITGTTFRPLDNEFQIREAVEKMIAIANSNKIHPLAKSLAAILLASYIQPFEDGNKRTARILGNAVLLANNYCPLSYRSIDESDYKKATLLFYEQGSARFFKELFTKQFQFAVKNYFLG